MRGRSFHVTAQKMGPLKLTCVFILLTLTLTVESLSPEEEKGAQYLKALDLNYSALCNKVVLTRWNYSTNVTPETEKKSVDIRNQFLQYQGQIQQEIIEKFPNWSNFTDKSLKREFRFLSIQGPAKMDPKLVEEMNALSSKMESAFANVKVCAFKDRKKCDLKLNPDVEETLQTSDNAEELAYYWTAFHDAISAQVPTKDYKRYIDLQNTFAKANGFPNMGDFWALSYEDGSEDWTAQKFEKEMLAVWEELRPFYNKLHAYVRMKLRALHPDQISKSGLLPAHLVGHLFTQDWTSLDSKTRPYPDVPLVDVTGAMVKAKYNASHMFRVSNKFFKDLDLLEMTETFWAKTLMERPKDREVVCHATAEDFCSGPGNTDFRIKMCTNINQKDLVTVHHEMGHIEYFMQFSNWSVTFRDAANPGFNEAIGDALALAVNTPKHLKCVLGLDIDVNVSCTESQKKAPVSKSDLNFLYYTALQIFPLFPFAISMDSWRWGIFDGSIPEAEYNRKWWSIRQSNQGISLPSIRPPENFDASAKYHTVSNVEYIRYFISYILQFQFYEALCIAAGEFNPSDPNSRHLHQCDFDGSKKAGKAFGDMMKLGFSEPWPVALKALTGTDKMSTKSLLNYFQPLFEYIDEQLKANNETVGFTAP